MMFLLGCWFVGRENHGETFRNQAFKVSRFLDGLGRCRVEFKSEGFFQLFEGILLEGSGSQKSSGQKMFQKHYKARLKNH